MEHQNGLDKQNYILAKKNIIFQIKTQSIKIAVQLKRRENILTY